jgi:hypothetical protein
VFPVVHKGFLQSFDTEIILFWSTLHVILPFLIRSRFPNISPVSDFVCFQEFFELLIVSLIGLRSAQEVSKAHFVVCRALSEKKTRRGRPALSVGAPSHWLGAQIE